MRRQTPSPALGRRPRGSSLALAAVAALAASRGTDAAPAKPALQLLGSTALPYAQQFDGVAFGGISAIERDPLSGRWYLLSDDKSAQGPARFYIAEIALGADGPGPVHIVQTVALQTELGQPYPRRLPAAQAGPAAETADAESLRRDPRSGDLWWASEGDAAAAAGPAIRRMDIAGHALGQWRLPPAFAFDPLGRSGPRPNLSIEGMSFDPAGRGLWFAMEGPLYQDGAESGATLGALVRLSLIDRAGQLLRQHAYRVDRLPSHDARLAADNGISEILAVDENHLLVLERTGLQQANEHYTFRTRLYCANLEHAPDTAQTPAFDDHAVAAAPKSLLFDLARSRRLARSNFEGMAWGPPLPDGRATLLLVSDNNFDPDHASDFALFASSRPLDAQWLQQHCAGPAP